MTNESNSTAELSFQKITLTGNSSESFPGRVAYQEWDEATRKKRALKKTAKIVGTIFACSLIGLFVHVLLIVIIPTLILTLVASAPLYMKYLNEKSTIHYGEGTCPYCKNEGKLRTYLDAKLSDTFTLQCPECGQTIRSNLESGSAS